MHVQKLRPIRPIATISPVQLAQYRASPRAIVSMPQGFKKPQPPMMTEALVSIAV